MNDFTKKELQTILEWSQLSIEYGTAGSTEEQQLDKKIQSLIDNYCEHEGYYKFNYGEHVINYCDKCKTTFKQIL